MPVRIHLIGFFLLAVNFTVVAQTTAPEPPTFTVSGYQVTGSNPLSAKATREILKQYVGRHEGLEGLQAAADALEQVIRSQGYSFHRVILPPQTLRDGVVQLQVIEFPLDKVLVEDNRYFSDDNVRNSLPGLQPGRSPNLRRLARGLRLANEHPAKQLTVGFKESETAQAVDANIKVHDRSPHTVFTALQNTGTEETGDYRLSLGYQYSNLFNRDQILSFVYTMSPDNTNAVSQYGVAYRVPLYSASSVINFAYASSDIDSGTVDTGEGVGFFNITGKGTVASLSYSYALPGGGRYQHDLTAGYDDKLFKNDLFFDGQQQSTSYSPVLCDENEGRVGTNPFSLGYKGILRGNSTTFGFSLGFFSNQAGGQYGDDQAYACVRYGAKSSWSATRYTLNLNQRIGGNWQLALRLSGQAAGEPLVPGEQFGLGGANSVRGYEERSILGDDGWQASLEIWTPPFTGNSMNFLLFYDLGHVESKIQTPVLDDTQTTVLSVTPDTIEYDPAGAGLGFRWVWNDQFSLRIDVATILEELAGFENVKKGDTKVHFSIYYRF